MTPQLALAVGVWVVGAALLARPTSDSVREQVRPLMVHLSPAWNTWGLTLYIALVVAAWPVFFAVFLYVLAREARRARAAKHLSAFARPRCGEGALEHAACLAPAGKYAPPPACGSESGDVAVWRVYRALLVEHTLDACADELPHAPVPEFVRLVCGAETVRDGLRRFALDVAYPDECARAPAIRLPARGRTGIFHGICERSKDSRGSP